MDEKKDFGSREVYVDLAGVRAGVKEDMYCHTMRFAEGLRFILKSIASLRTIRRLRRMIMLVKRRLRYLPRENQHRKRFSQYKRQYGHLLRHRLNGAKRGQKIALVASPVFPEVEMQLGVLKALELAEFTPVVLIPHGGRLLLKYYRLAAVRKVHFWNEFVDARDFDVPAANAIIRKSRSVRDLLKFEHEDARVGRLAVSTALRRLKRGSFDLEADDDRHVLANYMAEAMAYAKVAQRILNRFRPELALFVDTVYTPEGELFDNCLNNGIDTIQWQPAHRSNLLMLKRYTLKNANEHPTSLSSDSWRFVQDMQWTDAHREQLAMELYNNYASGDWYSVVSTQFNKRFVPAEEIRMQLGLDPLKKTAFIFPHIPWDATLFWGKCLFEDYEEWFIKTVQAACANDQVNWVIKVHPANVGKRVREGFQGEPAEVAALRQHIGELPRHIFLIQAESDISTLSLFKVMDFCLTVCGTVGIEAARLGIPVLTAGIGRYDRKGFTIDSESYEQYLERLAHIQTIPQLSASQREIAERFAYGIFLLRPLPLSTVTLEYHKDHKTFSSTARVNIKNTQDWYNASDLKVFSQWVKDYGQEDFLLPVYENTDSRLC